MGVALIAWGRFFDANGNKVTVPAPSTNPGAPWLWDFLAKEARSLRQVGFSAVQLPPASKAQGGAARVATAMAYSTFVISEANRNKAARQHATDRWSPCAA